LQWIDESSRRRIGLRHCQPGFVREGRALEWEKRAGEGQEKGRRERGRGPKRKYLSYYCTKWVKE